MKLRVCRRTGTSLLGWSVAILTMYATSLTLTRVPGRTSHPSRDSQPLCRPEMEVNMLPPMADDFNVMMKDLFTYITQPNRGACRKVLTFGGEGITKAEGYGNTLRRIVSYRDGHKYVCMDPEFSIMSTPDCLVYSFGISTDWSFDWDIEAFGCTVYAFDPSINTTTGWQNGTITFLQYGIGEYDLHDPNGWELRTLDTFVRHLHHTNRTIHYLKVDVENAEWAMLRQQLKYSDHSVLARNVEQIGMELHFYDHLPLRKHVNFYVETYQSFLSLQELGFYLFSYEPNQWGKPKLTVPGLPEMITTAVEVVWIKSQCVGKKSSPEKS